MTVFSLTRKIHESPKDATLYAHSLFIISFGISWHGKNVFITSELAKLENWNVLLAGIEPGILGSKDSPQVHYAIEAKLNFGEMRIH